MYWRPQPRNAPIRHSGSPAAVKKSSAQQRVVANDFVRNHGINTNHNIIQDWIGFVKGGTALDWGFPEVGTRSQRPGLAISVRPAWLGRNDVGRVSKYGSVNVEKTMFVERYSHVMHLVSQVKGTLEEGMDRFDALMSFFPAGTLSGAPKVRAMEIIDELETTRRGIYGGAIGYTDYQGNVDSCIVIRTIVVKDGKAYIQAGAGIVADSDPETEYQECMNKAMALFKAIKMAENGEFTVRAKGD